MTRQQAYDILHEVFWDVFDNDAIMVNDGTAADDIEEWDSLAHINLIVAVEKRFQIKFKIEEVVNLKNVGEMVAIILERTTL